MIAVFFGLLVSLILFFTDKIKFFISLFIFSTLLNSVFTIEILGANFSYPRLAFLIFPSLEFFSKGILKSFRFRQFFIYFYLIFFLTIISQINSKIANLYDWFYVIDDFFSTIGLLYLFVINHHLFISKNISEIIILSLNKLVLLCFLFGCLEIIIGDNIYSLLQLKNFTNSIYAGSHSFEGFNRISSVFNGTLEFTFFIAFGIIISFYSLNSDRNIDVNISRLNLFLAPLIMINTFSRLGLVLCILIVTIYFSLKFFYNHKNVLKIFRLLFLFLLVISFFNFTNIFNGITNQITGRTLEKFEEDSSLRERNRQLDYFLNSINKNKSFIGQGRINTLRFIEKSESIYSLDSFWLKLFFESGIISAVIFLFVMIKLLNKSFSQILRKSHFNRRIHILNTIFLICLIFMMTFSVTQDFKIFLIFIVFNTLLNRDTKLIFKN